MSCCFGFNFRFTSTCSYVGVLLFKLDYAWQQGMTTTKPSHPPNPPPNLTYPSLALSSTTLHSRLKTELFKLSYPNSTPVPRHVLSPPSVTTVAPPYHP